MSEGDGESEEKRAEMILEHRFRRVLKQVDYLLFIIMEKVGGGKIVW